MCSIASAGACVLKGTPDRTSASMYSLIPKYILIVYSIKSVNNKDKFVSKAHIFQETSKVNKQRTGQSFLITGTGKWKREKWGVRSYSYNILPFFLLLLFFLMKLPRYLISGKFSEWLLVEDNLVEIGI